MYNQGPFASWVPKILQLLLILFLFFPITAANGVFINNLQYIVGGAGILTEDVMMANYANTIGMAAIVPIFIRIKMFFKSKQIMVFGFTIMAIFTFICGTTDNAEVIILSTVIIGFFKMAVMMELILPMLAILSKDGNRIRFYMVFYSLILIYTQVANWFLFKIASADGWEYAPIILTATFGFCALLCIIFQHNKHFAKPVPLWFVDWFSLLLYLLASLSLAYSLTYAKQQGWLSSGKIVYAFVAFFVLTTWFIYRQTRLKRPFISMKIMQFSDIRHGLLMLIFLGLFLATNVILNTFTIGVLGYDLIHQNQFYLMMIPGILLAAVFTGVFLGKRISLKIYVFIGFFSYTLYTLLLYFMIVPELNYSIWYFPMILRGFAMTVLFIGIWYYAIARLNMQDMMSAIGIMLLVRTFASVAIGSAILSWAQYKFQWTSINNLGSTIDTATPSVYRNLQINAMMVSIKNVFGYVVLAGILIQIYVLSHHFGRINYRRKVIFYRLLQGKSVRGLRRRLIEK